MPTRPGIIFIVAAASGGGKTSLVKALVERVSNLHVSVSHTTRPIRPNEQDGVHYHFVSETDYQQLAQEGAFVEYAQVFNHHYATSQAAIAAPLALGHDVILDIDWQGAQQVKQLFPDQSAGIFLLPPSRQVLRQRLEGRGQDSKAIIDERMAKATDEMSHYHEFDYLVLNDQFDIAVDQLAAIVEAERVKLARQKKQHGGLIKKLLENS